MKQLKETTTDELVYDSRFGYCCRDCETTKRNYNAEEEEEIDYWKIVSFYVETTKRNYNSMKALD